MTLDDLYSMPGHLFRRAQQIAWAIFMEECQDFGITPVQYAALLAIDQSPGIDATRLSDVIAFDRSTLGNVLERLENRGLIARSEDAADRRVKRLRLTEVGQQLVADVKPSVQRAQARMLAPLRAQDRDQFLVLLEQVVSQNNEVSRAPLRLGASATEEAAPRRGRARRQGGGPVPDETI